MFLFVHLSICLFFYCFILIFFFFFLGGGGGVNTPELMNLSFFLYIYIFFIWEGTWPKEEVNNFWERSGSYFGYKKIMNFQRSHFHKKGPVKGRSNYILGKIHYILWIPINFKNFGNATLVDMSTQWFPVHFVPILSINTYN